MTKVGFFLKKLIMTGVNVENAEVEFKIGLNVIFGPSDTGKSYIFQCINYILGGNKEPKKIEESKGYSKIYLEILTFSNKPFTICRTLGQNEFSIWESKFLEIESHTCKLFSLKHSISNQYNVSSFLLKLIGISNFKIKKNAKGKLQNLTITNIKRLILIDETKIISESSVIHSAHQTQYTSEKSAFKTLITGSDDISCKEIEDPKIYKSRIKGKLELIDELIIKLNKDIEIKTRKQKETNFKKLHKDIERLEHLMKVNSKELTKKTTNREVLWDNLSEMESDVIIQNELLSRFNLLKNNLEIDIERLNFIKEGEHYLSQLPDTKCPICNGIIDLDAKIDLKDIQYSCNIEKEKVISKLNDLNKTVKDMKIYISKINTEIKQIKDDIVSIDNEITEEIKPVLIFNKNELEELYKLKSIEKEIYLFHNELNNLEAKKAILLDKLKLIPKKSEYISSISDDEYKKLCENIKDILKEWKYSDIGKVEYDHEKDDIIINGKKRINHGKGFRALLHSAFTIGVMQYSRMPKNHKSLHPGFVILDSPLTTYKGSDKPENEDIVPSETENAFFSYLNTINDKQIIVIDNKEPNKAIKNEINYEQFTKNNNYGRYGFFSIR